MVPVAGVEPARYRYQRILSPPRLPIPTHRLDIIIIQLLLEKSNNHIQLFFNFRLTEQHDNANNNKHQ